MQLPIETTEKNQMMLDTLAHKIPKRVISAPAYQMELVLENAGFSLKREQYNTDKWIEALDIFAKEYDVDILAPIAVRFASVYKILGSKNFVMGDSGFLQHPEIEGMHVEDYDSLINSAYDTLVEKIIPRIHSNISDNSFKSAEVKSKAFFLQMSNLMKMGQATAETAIKYNKATIGMYGSLTEAPFDFLADQLRGFTGIMGDIRRYPEKVCAACEALLPLNIKMGASKGPQGVKDHIIFIPLHMAPYMSEKNFERFWWPTFKKEIEALDAMNYTVYLFLEQDWSRFADYLLELPDNIILWAEYGDAAFFKNKLGKKHILTGFYPLRLIKSGTKEQVADEVKREIDILAPGGGYFFNFDKGPLVIDDINKENFKTAIQTVREYGVY